MTDNERLKAWGSAHTECSHQWEKIGGVPGAWVCVQCKIQRHPSVRISPKSYDPTRDLLLSEAELREMQGEDWNHLRDCLGTWPDVFAGRCVKHIWEPRLSGVGERCVSCGTTRSPRTQPDPDAVALAEMAAWLKSGTAQIRHIEIDRDRSSLCPISITLIQSYGEMKRHMPDAILDAVEPTIAEAWARIKQQEGFPR